MTALLSTVFFFAPLTFGCAALVAQWRERLFLWRAIAVAWATLGPLMIFINSMFPFSGFGDDFDYFEAATRVVYSFSDLISFTHFVGLQEQPGYPWLLSLLQYFLGNDLLTFKLLNFTFFIILATVWYHIGSLLESPQFGRSLFIFILFLTPIWFYIFFLFKDISIILLQSFFLLGLVSLWRCNSIIAWILIIFSTFGVILFRSPLVVQNLALLISCLLICDSSRGNSNNKKIINQVFGLVVVIGFIIIASNSNFMSSIGIYTEHRVVGSSMIESVSMRQGTSLMNKSLFPLLYFLSETSGLSAKTWAEFDPGWLRGVLAIPWIFFIMPFSLLGVYGLTRSSPQKYGSHRVGFRRSRLISTPWIVLVLFIISYVAISWKVGDTTRWRVPDMPVFAAFACSGWCNAAKRLRYDLMIFWMMGGCILFSFFYLIKGS